MFKQGRSVGLIGLGIIGAPVARHLRTAGFDVSVWNRTPKPEPNFLGSPAEVAAACNVIQLFVADPLAVNNVLDAMGETLTARHTVICSSTIGHAATLQIASRVHQSGARFLDAPFTGTKGAAEKAQLVYYIGGDEDTLLAVRPVLEASSKEILRIGAIGQAALVKVLTNILVASTIETLAEMVAVAKASGVAPEVLGTALASHGVHSGLIDLKLPKMISGDYEPHFSIKHLLKDVQFGIDLGANPKIDLPVTKTMANVLRQGLAKGWADLDCSAVMKNYS